MCRLTASLCPILGWIDRGMQSRCMIMTVVTIMLAVQTPMVRSACGQSSKKADDSIKWLTGSKLDQASRYSFSASWTEAPLRDRLKAFAKQQKIAVFVDRRVDSNLLVSVTGTRITVEQFLWKVAEESDLGVCRIEDFYYVGPVETAAVLPHVWKPLKKLSRQLSKSSKIDWRKNSPMKFHGIVEPKTILSRMATENQFSIKNPEELQHDVWPGFELPPLALDTRVSLMLVGFNQWMERSGDGAEIKIVEFPTIASGQTDFRDIRNAKKLALELKEQFPDLKISSTKKSIRATGDPVLIAGLTRALIGAVKPKSTNPDETPWTLKNTRASRRVILMKIAEVSGKKFSFTSDSVNDLNQQVLVNVKDATIEELVEEVLDGSDLRYEITEDNLRISDR